MAASASAEANAYEFFFMNGPPMRFANLMSVFARCRPAPWPARQPRFGAAALVRRAPRHHVKASVPSGAPAWGTRAAAAGQQNRRWPSLSSIAEPCPLPGPDPPAVTVEVHLANGLPSFTLVGLADTEVKESRERVRAALQTSGLEFPHNKRVTVSLAPADLPKESGRFDLPIALGVLASQGLLDEARLARCEFA